MQSKVMGHIQNNLIDTRRILKMRLDGQFSRLKTKAYHNYILKHLLWCIRQELGIDLLHNYFDACGFIKFNNSQDLSTHYTVRHIIVYFYNFNRFFFVSVPLKLVDTVQKTIIFKLFGVSLASKVSMGIIVILVYILLFRFNHHISVINCNLPLFICRYCWWFRHIKNK